MADLAPAANRTVAQPSEEQQKPDSGSPISTHVLVPQEQLTRLRELSCAGWKKSCSYALALTRLSSLSSSARIAAGLSARKRLPCPGSTHSNSKSKSRSIERICSGQEYQHTLRDALRFSPSSVPHRWSPVKRNSRYSNAALPGVWPGTGITVSSESSETGSSPATGGSTSAVPRPMSAR